MSEVCGEAEQWEPDWVGQRSTFLGETGPNGPKQPWPVCASHRLECRLVQERPERPTQVLGARIRKNAL